MKNLFHKILVFSFILFFNLGLSKAFAQSQAILFWGNGCPHCEIVKEQIKTQNIESKIKVEYKEIYSNAENLILYEKTIGGCGINTKVAGIPLLYKDNKCWMGQDEVMKALTEQLVEETIAIDQVSKTNTPIEKPVTATASTISKAEAIQEVPIPTSTVAPIDNNNDKLINSDGKRNTEIMLVTVLIGLISLISLGYVIQNKKSKKPNIAIVSLLLIFTPFIFTNQVHAVCPVCTVAVGAGLGFSRYLGIDDIITSLWIGGLIVSTIFWMIDWLSKKNKKGVIINVITTIATYLLVLVPLYYSDIIGHPYNTFWGIDKVLLGTAIGSIVFFAGAKLHFFLKQKNNDKVRIPFQKVVVPVGALWLSSFIFYLIIY